MTSSELTGGAGYTFEDATAAIYLAALLDGTTAVGLSPRIVQRVALQQASFGEPLDDLIVDGTSASDHTIARLSLQVKRALTISAAVSNLDFREVIQHSWDTLQKIDFRVDVDRVGAIAGTIAEDPFRAFVTVCEWARASPTPETFLQRFALDGNASQAHREVLSAVRNVAQGELKEPLGEYAAHHLFKHLVLIKLDLLHEGATAESDVVARLQRSLISSQAGRAGDLWRQLRQLAREGSGRSEVFNRGSVLQRLAGNLRFVGSPAHTGDLAVLRELTQHWLQQQSNEIGGTHVDRPTLRTKLNAEMAAHRLTLIKGLPGTGKTALLHDLLVRSADGGSTLFLSANHLSGRSWTEFARAIGLSSGLVEPLLVEIAASGSAVLFIDGIDRVVPAQRAILTDLLGEIVTHPLLSNWRVVATARDAGIEPLRNWLPAALLVQGGVGYVDVENLDDNESAVLARALPTLRPLLLNGDERVRGLARRPFFASVLARGFSSASYLAGFEPRSELDLIEAWWTRGGYDAEAGQSMARQLALVELAQRSASDLGRRLRLGSLTPATQVAFSSLEQDGLLRQVRSGHIAEFAHDIFFEWSFFHWLVDQGDAWVAALQQAGEPPALARVVELLSQATYLDAARWQRNLQDLQTSAVRPQWLRAWLLGPLFTSRFREQEGTFTASLTANDQHLLTKLLVWMQAEKTIANPFVLSGHLGAPDLAASARIRLADALSWPSDVPAWSRLIHWSLDHLSVFPDRCLKDLITVFETWQVAYADLANPVSERVIAQCSSWLDVIDQKYRNMHSTLPHVASGEATRSLAPIEKSLRALVLRVARAYPGVVSKYLSDISQVGRLPESTFHEVMSYAPLLAQTHAELLAAVAGVNFLEELPDDAVVRWRKEAVDQAQRREEIRAIPEDQRTRLQHLALMNPSLHNAFSDHEWDGLSIGADDRGYFPASPLREPFHSLLQSAPLVGLALVRSLVSHATTAWRQLHGRSSHREGTPVPLIMEFPWGRQEFWGTPREYMWFRGHGGPKAVVCALMALEKWALGELAAGRSADLVLQQLLEGQSGIAVLGIAVLVALESQLVSPVTLPLVTSQRLWRADLQRFVQDRQSLSVGLIGFDRSASDMVQRQAVIDANALPVRQQEIRALVSLFALTADEPLRTALRTALERFPQELGFDYEEEAANVKHVAGLTVTAELWSEWGRTENYVGVPVPGREDVMGIELRSARHADPRIQEARRRHLETSQEVELWMWVSNCFENGGWAPGFTDIEAVERAVVIGRAVAGGAIGLMPDNSIANGAISGTAATICCFDGDAALQTWADQTIASYRDQVETREPDLFSKSVLPWHPKIFVARALAARIRDGRAEDRDRADLYTLVTHPLEVVSLTAIEGIASCWAADSRFAWCGLNLALRLARFRRNSTADDYDPLAQLEDEQIRRGRDLAATVLEYETGSGYEEWVGPLPAWVERLPRGTRDGLVSGEDAWRRSDEVWLGDYAAQVLRRVPVKKVMSSPARPRYLNALEAYVVSTLETMNPAWRGTKARSRSDAGVDLYAWRSALGEALALVAPCAPATEVHSRLLKPIIDQPDDICMSLLAPFVDLLACTGVLDATQVEDTTLDLLGAALERTLQHHDLRKTGYSDGRVSGFDVPKIVKALLFVAVERADGAARFANGRWEELPRVLPLIDKLVVRGGWVPLVAREFITLCERAANAYPVNDFADQLLAHLADGLLPAGWKGTTIPAGIAGLVQAQADCHHPLPADLARKLLQILDALVDLGDRRSAALQQSEAFRGVRVFDWPSLMKSIPRKS